MSDLIRPIPPAVSDESALDHRRFERIRERDRCWEAVKRQAGERYVNCTFANFTASRADQQKVVKELRGYCADIEAHCKRGEGVVLYGPVGTGKDHLAYAIAWHAAKAEMLVQWINGQAWFGAIRDAIGHDYPEAAMISHYSRKDYLVISDPLPPVGALTEHQATMLYRLIEARYSKGLPTIATVNVADDKEADSRIGPPTWDRLCHGAWKVKCFWPTFRKPAKVIG